MPCGKGWPDLRVVHGFDAARAVLSRQAAGIHFETSPGLKKSLSDVFGRELTVEQAVSLAAEAPYPGLEQGSFPVYAEDIRHG